MMKEKTKFVLCGLGNIGSQVINSTLNNHQNNLEIVAVCSRNKEKAQKKINDFKLNIPIISASEAPNYAKVIVETATYESFREVVEPAIISGCHVIAISVGALVKNLDLIDLANKHNSILQIANGTLPGLDILRSAKEGNVNTVKLKSKILPESLEGEEYIENNNIDLSKANKEAVFIFSGSAREAAQHFPRHFNVSVSLSLAGIGLDKTQIEVYADGTLKGALHKIIIKSDVVELEMTSQNFPSSVNKRSSLIVAKSIIAALREINSHIRIGS